MRTLSHSPARLLAAAALAAAGYVACDSPFEPKGGGERIPIGVVIEQAVTSDSARFYSFTTSPSAAYAVYVQALEGSVWLRVIDSTSGNTIVSMTASPAPGSPRLEDNEVSSFGVGAARRVCKIIVQQVGAGTSASFRFKIDAINTQPEHVFAVFAIGDTVTGETIDPKVDLDRFVVMGTAGQEIVIVGETPAPVGSGSVAFTLIDTVGQQFLGYVFADAGPPTLTSGRLRLPATRGYPLYVGSVISNIYPRYHGPYRFWTYAINRAPEHRSASPPPSSEITNERIDRAGDIDEFTFTTAAGNLFNAFVQAPRAVQVEIAPLGGEALGVAVSAPSDTGLFDHGTGRVPAPQAGTYVVRVIGTVNQIADTGAYRLFWYPIDPRPEHVPAAITPGDTVTGESIEIPGDIDEFTFSGTAGELYDAYLQAQSGSPETDLEIWALDPSGALIRNTHSFGADTGLFNQVTGRFALPTTGTYRLRVMGADSRSDRDRGPYRVFLHRVDPRPESVSETLVFGDSLSGESIDLPGDFDEFHVTVPDSSGANLAFELLAPSPPYPGLIVKLINATTDQVIATASGSSGARAATGRLSLAPGQYIVRVDASVDLDFSTVRGPYRLWFYRFGFRPETVSDTIAIGDTVSGEVIEPWGDDDAFHFYGLRGQHVNIALQGLAAPGGTFQAWISGPPNASEYMFASVSSGTSAAALHDHQTRRMDLTVTGWYHVSVFGDGFADRGPYRFAVESLSVAPEHVSSALVPGDSVTTEFIDTPGDWDEFTVTAAPGQEVYALFRDSPFMRFSDGATGDSLAALYGWAYDKILGPVRVPSTGQVRIMAYQPASFVRFCYDSTCGGVLPFVGPYRFRVLPLNRAPESAPATFAIGDTVRGEAVSPVGDIDEFTATGTPADTQSVWWHLTADPTPTEGLITLEVVDPVTGAVLAGSGVSQFRASPAFYQQSFVVPAGGAYVIRVKGYGLFGDGTATAPYEFFVTLGP